MKLLGAKQSFCLVGCDGSSSGCGSKQVNFCIQEGQDEETLELRSGMLSQSRSGRPSLRFGKGGVFFTLLGFLAFGGFLA